MFCMSKCSQSWRKEVEEHIIDVFCKMIRLKVVHLDLKLCTCIVVIYVIYSCIIWPKQLTGVLIDASEKNGDDLTA